VTGIPVTRKALGTEKETAEAEEIMVARVKKKMEGKHRDQQRHNEISTPIQPQHLSNESARLKRLMGQGKNFFFGFCGLSEFKKTRGKLTDQPGILIPLDRGGVPDLSVSGINLNLVVVRPSRSDYDERTRCANAVAEPYLQWLPTSRCKISLITKIIFPIRNR
jgi:hypothetical protein